MASVISLARFVSALALTPATIHINAQENERRTFHRGTVEGCYYELLLFKQSGEDAAVLANWLADRSYDPNYAAVTYVEMPSEDVFHVRVNQLISPKIPLDMFYAMSRKK